MRKGFFTRKADTLLGVDINDTAIRLVELGHSGGVYRVRGYVTQALPVRSVVEGELLELESVGRTLQVALHRLHTGVRAAAVAVAGPSVITRVIEMAAGLNEDEMARNIQAEAAQHIPYPLDEVAIDFQVQGRSPSDPARVEVLLAACLKVHVESREAVLALAGLVPKVIDVEAFALARACGQDFASFTPGHRVDGAQWAVDAQSMGVACGLALRSFA